MTRLKGRQALESVFMCETGQACLLVFGIQTFIFSCIHSHQLAVDTRFVNAPDKPEPHESLTFRWVRVIDAFVAFFWSIFMAGLSLRLRNKQITGTSARKLLLGSLASVTCIYTIGMLVDFAQCHFQAGGIGAHCHGFNCIQVALVLGMTMCVGEYKPQFFCAVCFGGQGLYRLWWALREERPVVVTATVSTMSIMLVVEDVIDWHLCNFSRCSGHEERIVDTV
jgi:hypothetical protein